MEKKLKCNNVCLIKNASKRLSTFNISYNIHTYIIYSIHVLENALEEGN